MISTCDDYRLTWISNVEILYIHVRILHIHVWRIWSHADIKISPRGYIVYPRGDNKYPHADTSLFFIFFIYPSVDPNPIFFCEKYFVPWTLQTVSAIRFKKFTARDIFDRFNGHPREVQKKITKKIFFWLLPKKSILHYKICGWSDWMSQAMENFIQKQ